MKTILLYLITMLSIAAVEIETIQTFSENAAEGIYDLGERGIWIIDISDDQQQIAAYKNTVTIELFDSKRRNVLIGRLGNNGISMQSLSNGKIILSYKNNMYENAEPSSNDSFRHSDWKVVASASNEPNIIEPNIIEPNIIEPNIIEPNIIEPNIIEPKDKNNNGHGNNQDGVDSSNPGKGPKKEQDTDPNDDDEKAK